MLKILRAGEPNRDVIEISTNVRQPDETIGDIYAQYQLERGGAERLRSCSDEWVDLRTSRDRRRDHLALGAGDAGGDRRLPDGVYTNEAWTTASTSVLLRCTVTSTVTRCTSDWAGSSPQSRRHQPRAQLHHAYARTR